MLGIGGSLTRISEHEQLYSVAFDGTGDYIDTNSTFQSTIRGNFSVSCWVNLSDSTPAASNYIWGSNLGHTDKLYCGYTSSGPRWYFYIESDNDSDSINYASGLTGDGPTGWYNVMVTVALVGGGDSVIRLYVNGSELVNSTSGMTSANQANFTTTSNMFIGCYNNEGTPASLLTGNISDWAIWNGTLDADNATAVYNSGKPFDLTHNRGNYDKASGLVSYYKMNDGSGTTVVDSMGNSNGTLVADAAFGASTPDD